MLVLLTAAVLPATETFAYPSGELVPGPVKQVASSTLRARHLTAFNSPDRKTFCLSSPSYSLDCGTIPKFPRKSPEHSGWIDARTGKVTLCFNAGANLANSCFVNWNNNSPVLHFGQKNRIGPFRCVSRHRGITCIKVTGRGAGKGFRINRKRAVKVRISV